MTKTRNLKDEAEEIFNVAEEHFVIDVQMLLHNLMEAKGITRSELARRMNVSRARISQIFSDDCENLTARLIARIFDAMGEYPELSCDWENLRRASENEDITSSAAYEDTSPDPTFWNVFDLDAVRQRKKRQKRLMVADDTVGSDLHEQVVESGWLIEACANG